MSTQPRPALSTFEGKSALETWLMSTKPRPLSLLHLKAAGEIDPYKSASMILRAFAPIVSAHPYCARNSFRDAMPRHALSARAVAEIWR